MTNRSRNIESVLQDFPELITIEELMAYLGCSRTKANALCRERHGFSFKIGGTWYVDRNRFISWINKQLRV